MLTSVEIQEVSKAVSKLQGLMRPALKDAKNPYFKSLYSTYASMWESLREPLAQCQLAVFQDAISTPKGVSIMTRIVHSSGQWIEFGPLEIPVKQEAQSIGSAVTYAKRYALSAALGIVSDEDDDGNLANKNAPESFISESQSQELKSLCIDPDWETGLCDWLRIPSLRSIPTHRFESCKQILILKQKKASHENQSSPEHS